MVLERLAEFGRLASAIGADEATLGGLRELETPFRPSA